MYAHALIFMGAAAWALQRDEHVRVDIFYLQFSARRKALVEILGNLLFLLPFCLFLGWNSWDYVTASWSTLEKSNEASGLPLVYLQKSIILLLVASLTLQSLAELIRFGLTLGGQLPHDEVQHG